MKADSFSDPGELAADATGREVALWACCQRALLLLETLAADVFPDEAAFHAWIQRQQGINLRSETKEGGLYQTAEMQCYVCGHEWVAVFPIEAGNLECPECHNTTTVERE